MSKYEDSFVLLDGIYYGSAEWLTYEIKWYARKKGELDNQSSPMSDSEKKSND